MFCFFADSATTCRGGTRGPELCCPSSLFSVLFLGVAIISDIFMSAIERVTSKKMRKFNMNTNRYVTIIVWNPIIANFSLMALSSSVPEILLSVIELLSGGMKSGELFCPRLGRSSMGYRWLEVRCKV